MQWFKRLWRHLFPVRVEYYPWIEIVGNETPAIKALYLTLSRDYETHEAFYQYWIAQMKNLERGIKPRPGSDKEAKEWDADIITRTAKIAAIREVLSTPIHAKKMLQNAENREKAAQAQESANKLSTNLPPS